MRLSILSSAIAFVSFVASGAFAHPASDAYLISRNPAPVAEISSLKLTSNYAPITHVKRSNKAKRSISKRGDGYGSAKMRDLEVGGLWTMKMKFGGQKFDVLIDTARSDTWFIQKGFQCLNSTDLPVPEADCGFGAPFDGDFPGGVLKNKNFLTYPRYPQYAIGELGLGRLKISGIAVPRQEVALISRSYYDGDGVTSGVLGLGYAALTRAYIGDDPSLDNVSATGTAPGDRTRYRPIIQTMVEENLIASPLFSLAIQRSTSLAYNTPGGYIAFGGLPPVSFDPVFTSVPIDIFQPTGYPAWYATERSFYTIQPDGYVVGNTTGTHVQYPSSFHTVIESNYGGLVLPTSVFNAFLAGLSSPAVLDPEYGAWVVPCNVTTPYFGVSISGVVFPISGVDMIGNYTVSQSSEVLFCFVAAFDGGETPGPFFELGTPFLRNVVAVFDVGASMMRFAKHVY